MDIALQVQAKSTNTSKTKKSASSADQEVTAIALIAPLVSIDTDTVVTNVFGVAQLHQGIALPVLGKFTKGSK